MKIISHALTLILKIICYVTIICCVLISTIVNTLFNESWMKDNLNTDEEKQMAIESTVEAVFTGLRDYDGEFLKIGNAEIPIMSEMMERRITMIVYIIEHKVLIQLLSLAIGILPILGIIGLNHYPTYNIFKSVYATILTSGLTLILIAIWTTDQSISQVSNTLISMTPSVFDTNTILIPLQSYILAYALHIRIAGIILVAISVVSAVIYKKMKHTYEQNRNYRGYN